MGATKNNTGGHLKIRGTGKNSSMRDHTKFLEGFEENRGARLSEACYRGVFKKSRQKAIEIEIAFFSSVCQSQGSHIGPFLLCFTYPS